MPRGALKPEMDSAMLDLEKRNLTDADIKAIIAEMKKEFFINVGQGIWSLVWKGALLLMLAFAAYNNLKK
jgi:hypothetical protein